MHCKANIVLSKPINFADGLQKLQRCAQLKSAARVSGGPADCYLPNQETFNGLNLASLSDCTADHICR